MTLALRRMDVDCSSVTVTLRCHSCSHALGTVPFPMKLAGIFKASLMGRVGISHVGEVRRRCSSCGWVNVFQPYTSKEVELK